MLVKIGFLSLILSALLCFVFIFLCRRNGALNDNHSGIQNIHKESVPRIGGLAIFISFAIGLIIFSIRFNDRNYILLLISTLLPFLSGLYDDLTNKLSARVRLMMLFFGAFASIFLLQAYITRTGIFFLDYLVRYKIFAFIFAAIAIAGVTNALNIIDGLNGLSSGTAMLFLMALGYFAFKLQDFFILSITVLLGAAILGFFIWNYPYGRIFLGDGGAYLIGFILALVSILLVNRNAEISPWFTILILIYPVFETLFSIYRRIFRKKKSALSADFLHLHSLFFRRVIPYIFIDELEPRTRNSATSPFLWILCSFSIIPAVMFWNKTILLIIFCALFIFLYSYLYKIILSFEIGKYVKPVIKMNNR